MNQSHYLKVFVLAGLFMATHAGVSWANDAERPFSKKEYIKENWNSFSDEQKANIRGHFKNEGRDADKMQYIKDNWDNFSDEQKAKIKERIKGEEHQRPH